MRWTWWRWWMQPTYEVLLGACLVVVPVLVISAFV